MSQHIMIDYTNHAGVRAVREIIPLLNGIRFGSTDWHHEPQWLLDAHDVGKDDMRTFAMKDIHSWAPKESASGRAMEAIARQLHRSMERNARMVNRLKKLADKLTEDAGSCAEEHARECRSAIESILKDEEPTW